MLPQLLLNLVPKLNQSLRTDCPFCGGKNTFTISNKSGKVLWHCYRASCGTKGVADKELTKDELNNASILYNNDNSTTRFNVPDIFVNVLSSEKAVKFLTRFNCLKPYLENRVDIRYDPKQDRVVFIVARDKTILGATGRSLSWNSTPKWYRYDKQNNLLFICEGKDNVSKTCVIVEDAVSACAVSNINVDGCALLGTALVDTAISTIERYSLVKIALDYDATNKAIKFQRELNTFVPTEIVMLQKDIKYLTLDEMRNLL